MCCIVHNIDNNTNDNVYDNTAVQYLTTLSHIVFCIVICIVTYCQYSYNIANCIVTNIVRVSNTILNNTHQNCHMYC